MKQAFIELLLVFGAVLFVFGLRSKLTVDADNSYALKVLSVDGRKAIIQPYVAPTLDVEVESGKPATYLENCQQVVTERKFEDHTESVVVLKCEHDVVLEVKGLHLQ